MGSDDEEYVINTEATSRLSRLAARRFPFHEFCQFLSEHSNLTKNDFDELIRKFHSLITDDDEKDPEFSAYPVVRLLLPVNDRRKCIFTGKMLQRSLDTFVPEVAKVRKLNADGLSAVVSENFPSTGHSLSVDDVNKYLDILAFDRPKRTHTIQLMCSKMNRLELQWLFRIILAEIAESITGKSNGKTTIMGYLAPNAKDLHHAGLSLLAICVGSNVADEMGVSVSNALILGKPVRPMLLSKAKCDGDDMLKIIKTCGRPFYAETKYDGEHFLLHRIQSSDYLFFSRKGVDFTPQLKSFSERIHHYFKSSCVDCVLDCELVVWDIRKKRILGKNRQTDGGRVLDAKYWDSNDSNYQRGLVVFDVLLLNNESIFQKPLHERLGILRKSIFEDCDETIITIAPQKEISKIDDFKAFYSDHIKNGEEGIVIKGKNTEYRFGQRTIQNGWFKVKPDYGSRLVLDLAAVGIRYDDASHSKIKSILVAALTDTKRLRIVGGVTSHLRKPDFDRLLNEMNIRNLGTNERPPFIEGTSRDKVSLFVPLKNVQVVEVKASGILNSKLQFPSITALRRDKFVDEVNTTSDVSAYETTMRAQKHKSVVNDDTFVLKRSKQRRVVIGAASAASKAAMPNLAAQTPLVGLKVWVIDDSPRVGILRASKQQLRHFGATVVENYVDDIAFAVTLEPNGVKTAALIKRNTVNVVSNSWVQKCSAAASVLKWTPEDMIHTVPNAAFTLLEYEEQPSNENEMRQMSIEGNEEEKPNESTIKEEVKEEPMEAEELEQNGDISPNAEIEEFAEPNQLFSDFTFFIADDVEALDARDLIRRNGGKLVHELSDTVTHLFFAEKYDFGDDPKGWANWLDGKGWTTVLTNEEWLTKAIADSNRYLDSLPVPEVATDD